MADLEKLANILGADTVKEIYKDGASQPLQETSKVAVDFIKAMRLFTAPVQLLAAYQDRLTVHLDKVRQKVATEDQIEAPASLSGPILERLKYLEDDNYLTKLYLNLLARAIDRKRINEAHPAFKNVVDQLSPDEALFLYKLKDVEIEMVSHRKYNHITNLFSNYKITESGIDINEFTFPDNFEMYYSHFESLNLVRWPVYHKEFPKDEFGNQNGLIEYSKILLTDFGKLFVKACIPEDGFNNINRI